VSLADDGKCLFWDLSAKNATPLATLVEGVVPAVASTILSGNRYLVCFAASALTVIDLSDRRPVDSLVLVHDMTPTAFYPYFDYSDHLRIIVGCESGAFFTVRFDSVKRLYHSRNISQVSYDHSSLRTP